MKTSSPGDFLSQSELEDFLNGKSSPEAKARVKKLLDDCELSKEALAGFTAMPDAIGDIPALKKSIALKSGMTTAKILNYVMLGLGITLVIAMGYALMPNGKDSQIKQIVQIAQSDSSANNLPVTTTQPTTVISQVDISPQGEHFVNPEMKPVMQNAILAPAVSHDSVNTTNPNTDVAAGNKKAVTDSVVAPVVPVIPKNPEPDYNASVGFIFDLKITEFEKYKKKTMVVYTPQLSGIPAKFDNLASAQDGDQDELREVPVSQILNDGLKEFHDAHYGRCIEKMELLKKYNANDLNATFYMGVSYVKLEMYGNAIPYFDQILAAQNNVFHEEASWYKALALIGNGNVDAAKKLLNEIASKDGFYKEKAKEKLAEL